MAAPRRFAALIDQDSVVVLEYREETAGFRIMETRALNRRFSEPEAAAAGVVELLEEMGARRVCLSIVLQHFGTFFHTLVMPPAPDEVLRPAILREIQRSFNISDPAIAFAAGMPTERRDAARAGGPLPRQMLIVGAPKTVVESLRAAFASARIVVEGLTLVPEVFRRLYDALDGSTEATAVLVCLHNGPHVAFFVNGQLELTIEPALALEGEAPLDSAVIVDQLERGAIFLRQQARGTVATRLLLSAPPREYESLASIIEARTGMRVAPLGVGIGSPEAVVAMGAVLAARGPQRLDLYPREPAFDQRLKRAMSGSSFFVTALHTAAAVAAFWCAMQLLTLSRTRADVERLQSQVRQSLPGVASARQSAQGRERIAAIRSALAESNAERAAVARLLSTVASATRPGTRMDSLAIVRGQEGLQTKVFGRAQGASGPAAMSAATAFYREFGTRKELKNLDFESSYIPRGPADRSALAHDDLRFTISFLAPAGVP